VGRLDFLETILQAFTIDSGGQRAEGGDLLSGDILGDVADDHREGGFFGGRRGTGIFFVYGGDGDREAVCGDLKGLNKIGDDRGFEHNQRGFVIIDSAERISDRE
jgi:hypothetical protein